MHILRKLGLVFAASLLPIFLFSFGLGFSLFQVFGSPSHIKTALEQSGVYSTFISDVLSDVKIGEGQSQGIPASQPEVRKIIQQAISPDFLQDQTEGFLDSMYAWIRGDTKQLQVELNLTQAKANLSEGLTQYANDRLVNLPLCSSEIPQQASFDALNAECIPPGMDRATAVQQVQQEIAGGDFLKDPVIDEEDIKNKEGKPLAEQLKDVPGIYSSVATGLWVSGLTIVLITAGVVFLSETWRAGVKRAGITFICLGALSAALAWGASFATDMLSNSLIDSNESEIQTTIAKLANILANDLRAWWLGYGLVVLGLGIGALITLKCIKSSTQKSEAPVEKINTTDHLPENGQPKSPTKKL